MSPACDGATRPRPESHNTLLETAGVLYGLTNLPLAPNRPLLIRSDNTAALAAARRGYSPASLVLTELGIKIRLYLDALLIHHRVVHLPGVANGLADLASRRWLEGDKYLRLEWPVSAPHLWAVVDSLTLPHRPPLRPQIDAFACSWNTKAPLFWAIRKDPLAAAIDAFAQQWAGTSLLLNPPFHLASRVVAKLLDQPPAQAIIVLPDWPNQPWFQRLRRTGWPSALLPPEAILEGPLATPALANPAWRIRVWVADC